MSKKQSRVVINIVNDIDPTSMPLNEFVLYRAKIYPEEKHFVIVFFPIAKEIKYLYESRLAAYNISLVECNKKLRIFYQNIFRLIEDTIERKQPLLCHLHHPKIACIFQFLSLLLLLRSRFDIPKLYTVHNVYNRYSSLNKIGTVLNILLSHIVGFNSYSSYKATPYRIRQIIKSKSSVIYNGIDINAIDSVAKESFSITNSDNRQFKLVSVNRAVKQKNLSFLLEVLTQLPHHFTLTLVGDGPLLMSLQSEAEKLNLSNRVFFTGLLKREDVYKEVFNSDIYISSSIWEGLGNAVLEAMALKLPVILSKISPYQEIAKHSKNGVKVLDLNISEWATAIRELSLEPKGTLEKLGQQNRAVVEQNFSLMRMHKSYSKLYKKLCNSNQSIENL